MPAPNGKLHIFDTDASWQVTPKLILEGDGGYVIECEWANAVPGESPAPSHVLGGAGHAALQLTQHADSPHVANTFLIAVDSSAESSRR